MIEEWRIINESYQVSNLGRVKSLKWGKERILKQVVDGNGYLIVNPNSKTKKVHKLVAEAFLNHKPDGYNVVVDHIDNDKLNNRLDNLQLISARENCSKDQKGYSSKYIGVHWDKSTEKWFSSIQINGKQKYLGRFTNELDASEAYQTALSNLV